MYISACYRHPLGGPFFVRNEPEGLSYGQSCACLIPSPTSHSSFFYCLLLHVSSITQYRKCMYRCII